jgi:hypothetical protein
MPIAVEGVNEVKRALRKFDPDLFKELNKEVGTSLKAISNSAKLEVPNNFLSGAMDMGAERQSRTSRSRAFPVYNSSSIRKGLTYSLARKKGNSSGWTAAYSLLNKSHMGAIVEIAGTKNPYGDPRSQSNNPQAGRQFIEGLNRDVGSIKSVGKGRGRLMYEALYKDQGKARDAIIKAIETAATKYKAATR